MSQLTVTIEIGTRQIRAALIDPSEITGDRRVPVVQRTIAKEADIGHISVDPELAQLVADVANDVSQDRQAEVRAVAISCSAAVNKNGHISPHGPEVGSSETQPHRQYPFRKPVATRLRLIFKPDTLLGIGNRSDLAAWGEYKFGHTSPDMVFVSVGGIVGAGVIARGKLIFGHNGFAGQIGHTLAATDTSAKCNICGQIGCLSAVVSGTAFLAQLEQRKTEAGAKQLIEYMAARPTPPTEDMGQKAKVNGATLDARALVRAAGVEDPRTHKLMYPLAHDIAMTSVRPLGVAIAQLISFLDPRYVVIGGIFVDTDYLDTAIAGAVRDHLPEFRQNINLIRRSGFSGLDEYGDFSGDEAALYGGACWVWDYPTTALGG